VKRYKYTKLLKLGPVDGFLIHTPDGRKLKDTHPQTIVKELNRLNVEIEEKRKDIVYLATEKAKLDDRIKRLEEAGDAAIHEAGHEREHDALEIWNKAKEDKP
jgi:uncharacterized protein YdcH (DUF465 family)